MTVMDFWLTSEFHLWNLMVQNLSLNIKAQEVEFSFVFNLKSLSLRAHIHTDEIFQKNSSEILLD